MRALLLLLLIPSVLAAVAGEPELVTARPVAAATPAAGTGFAAWQDADAGMMLKFRGDGTVYSLTDDSQAYGESGIVADGDHIAWIRERTVRANPGSEILSINSDYVVYDVKRQAEIYDSRTRSENESRIDVAGQRIGFFSDAGGQTRYWTATLSGSGAFDAVLVRDATPYQAAIAPERVVLLEAGSAGPQIVSVEFASGQATVLASYEAGIGKTGPVAAGARTGWIENEGRSSRIVVVEEGRRWSWDDDGSFRFTDLQIAGDIVVAEASSQGQRRLVAFCLPEGERMDLTTSGSYSRPMPTPWGSVLSLRLVQKDFFLYEQQAACGEISAEGQTTPGLSVLVPAAVLILVSIARSSQNAGCPRR